MPPSHTAKYPNLIPNKPIEVDLLGALGDAFIVFFGVWTLTHQLSYFAGLSFHQSWNFAFFFSCIGVLANCFCTLKFKGKPVFLGPSVVWACALLSSLLAVLLYRPDSDDEQYLGHAILALDFTFEKMKSLTGISTGYALTSYDFIRAALSYYTGIPILYVFYSLGPAIISIFVIIFQWRLLKLLSIKYIGLAFLVFFIVMLAWGDVHRSPANLGYVKFFQGKGALVWVAIPAMLFYWLNFEITRNKNSLLLLFLAAICGVGFSPTGIPIAILMAFLFFISGLMQVKSKKAFLGRTLLLSISLIGFLMLGLLISKYFNYHSSGIHSSVGIRQLNRLSDYLVNWEMLHFVLGDTKRFWLALLALVLAPFVLPQSPARNLMRAYLAACITLMLIPISSAVMAQFSAGSFAWRWLFVCPFLLCVMALVDWILSSAWNRLIKIFAIGAFLGLFIMSGPLLVSDSNHTQIRLLFHQLPDEQKIILRPEPYNNQTTRLEGSRVISLKDGRPL
ncbi:hypothetical protein [Polynucleobacter yangtzensis]|uniref:hypothetical protein n=1 Tax=Polynucleobacter yangtzensis TaxID=1743159 RepID=UPI00249272FD|nr:hypothetical protein [Polynucleobacter yangtzensis]